MAKLYTSKTWLEAQLYVLHRTPEEIAKASGASLATVYSYIKKFGLRIP